jgi:hypothetical protein
VLILSDLSKEAMEWFILAAIVAGIIKGLLKSRNDR